MRQNGNHVVRVQLRARTYCDFNCDFQIDGDAHTPEQLQALADKVCREVDSGLYEPDPDRWDELESVAELMDEPNLKPTYRASLIGGEWKIEGAYTTELDSEVEDELDLDLEDVNEDGSLNRERFIERLYQQCRDHGLSSEARGVIDRYAALVKELKDNGDL